MENDNKDKFEKAHVMVPLSIPICNPDLILTDASNKGGARANSGRKSRKELGLENFVKTSVAVEASVLETCKKEYGSLAGALRFAAEQADKQP